jgi:hypothetical protein
MAELEGSAAYLHGNRLGSVLVVKGIPGDVERLGNPPFFGPDGEALSSAFEALGWGAKNWCGLLLAPVGEAPLSAERLRWLIETIDPRVILAVDRAAATEIVSCYYKSNSAAATEAEYEFAASRLKAGSTSYVFGRQLGFVDGFETMLKVAQSRQQAWAQLKILRKGPF